MSRTTVLLIVIPLTVILAAALLLPRLLDKEKILDLAAGALHEQTGMTLRVAGAVELDLLPGVGVSLQEVSLTMPGEQQSSLQLRSLSIGMQLLPLLAGKAEVDSLSLDGLHTRIQQGEQADAVDATELTDQQLDEFYETRRRELAAADQAAGAEVILAAPLALNVQQLRLTDATIELINSAGAVETVIELPNLEVSGLNLAARPVDIRASILVPGERPLKLALDGSVRIDQHRQLLGLDRLELTVDGAVAGEIKLQASGDVDIARQIADLQIALASGATHGDGKLRYASFESPQIDTRLRFNRLDPALLALAGPEAATVDTGTDSTGTSGDKPLPLEAIRLIDTRAELAVEQAVFGAHSIQGMDLKLRALDGVINIEALTGELHGGRLELQAVFDGKHNRASLDTTGSLAGLDLATALAAVAAEPSLTGTATLDWQLTSRGRTGNELVAALKGPVKLGTEQVVLNAVGIEGMLCRAVALTNQEALTTNFPNSSSFQTLSVDIKLADGKARLRPLRADLPNIALTGTGVYDLVSRDFDASFKAKLAPGLEELDRACRVSKRLIAIEWPVDCVGNTATDPAKWCRVDTEEVIEDLATNEVMRNLQKKAGKLFDKLFN
jgi:uncharacterized protein involved in outer membrane biogenesis